MPDLEPALYLAHPEYLTHLHRLGEDLEGVTLCPWASLACAVG